DRIDAQPVNVVSLQPEHCAAQQKAAHLVAAVIEYVAVPVFVNALAWIGMLEQVRAVEEPESPIVRRKMGGYPVQNDGYPTLVKIVDQIHQVLRCAVSA